jgi:hypothetical protein
MLSKLMFTPKSLWVGVTLIIEEPIVFRPLVCKFSMLAVLMSLKFLFSSKTIGVAVTLLTEELIRRRLLVCELRVLAFLMAFKLVFIPTPPSLAALLAENWTICGALVPKFSACVFSHFVFTIGLLLLFQQRSNTLGPGSSLVM